MAFGWQMSGLSALNPKPSTLNCTQLSFKAFAGFESPPKASFVGIWAVGFKLQGSRCRVYDLGFRVWDLGLRVWDLGFRI